MDGRPTNLIKTFHYTKGSLFLMAESSILNNQAENAANKISYDVSESSGYNIEIPLRGGFKVPFWREELKIFQIFDFFVLPSCPKIW